MITLKEPIYKNKCYLIKIGKIQIERNNSHKKYNEPPITFKPNHVNKVPILYLIHIGSSLKLVLTT